MSNLIYTAGMKFCKYHALGNDYLVLPPTDVSDLPTPSQIRRLCGRHFGIGADGILFGPLQVEGYDFALRIFNPDGSEAEKSGNGLRILARYLWDTGRVGNGPFTILTAGGAVTARMHADGRNVTVQMGVVSFDSTRIPVAGPPREVLNETLEIDGEALRYCAATVGNPHCVILRERASEEEARRLGPRIETATRFPNRTNVQFMRVLDRRNIQIEIWERGAGYTLASGSSSCAAAAVARRLGLGEGDIAVHMPGGTLRIQVAADWAVSMTGPVTHVCDGAIDEEIFE